MLNSALLLGAVVAALLDHWPGVNAVWLSLLLLLNVALALGLGVVLGCLPVIRPRWFRGALQFAFWFTPIVYTPNVVPERYASLLGLNSLAPLAGAYQNVLLYDRMPQWSSQWPLALLAAVLLVLALVISRRASPEMVGVL